jgi:hypothetical protein
LPEGQVTAAGVMGGIGDGITRASGKEVIYRAGVDRVAFRAMDWQEESSSSTQ